MAPPRVSAFLGLLFASFILLYISLAPGASAVANPLRLHHKRSLEEHDFGAPAAAQNGDALAGRSRDEAKPYRERPSLVRSGQPPRAASAVEWCGTSDDIFTLSSLVLTPDPPAKGANLTVRVEGYLKETIVQGAYADVVVKIGVVKLLDTRLDLCAQGKEFVGEECPVQPGERVLEKIVEIPEQAPKGKYKVAAVMRNADDKQIACVNAAWDWED